MPKGFGKVQPSKTNRKPKIKNFAFLFHSSDGSLNVLEVEARSTQEAVSRFDAFKANLELYLSNPADKELEQFFKKRSVNTSTDGGEA